MSDLRKFDFGCSNCVEFWNVIRGRRRSPIPVDESNLHFCDNCYRRNSSSAGLPYKNPY